MQKPGPGPLRRDLSNAYLCATLSLPDELRARLPLDELAIQKLSEGRNLAIRGFWRIGKTELMRGAIGGACERFSQSGVFFDLRSDLHEDGLPKTEGEVLCKITGHLEDFFAAMGSDAKVDPANPLRSLESAKGPIYLGIDEMVALHALGEEGMGRIIAMVKALPDNIRLIAVCHRNREVDGIFEREFGSDERFDTIYIPPITDDEAERLIMTPAARLGYAFTPGAISALFRKSGNRPWELFTYAFMAARLMEGMGFSEAGEELVEEAVSLQSASRFDFGALVLDNYARIYILAMNEGERETMKRLALGTFDEKTADTASIISLLQNGWIRNDSGWEIHSTIFRDFISGLECGGICLRTDKG